MQWKECPKIEPILTYLSLIKTMQKTMLFQKLNINFEKTQKSIQIVTSNRK